MIKKSKNKIWILFLLLLIIAIAGCDILQRDGKEDGKDFKRGAEGLVMEFVKNYPGDRYLVGDQDEDILIIVDVRNKGTYPTGDFPEGNIYLSGFDDAIIKMDEKTRGLSGMFLPAASSINPLGGFDAAEFKGKIVAEKLTIDEYNPIILVTACYPYSTKSSPTVCIDPRPFEDRQEKVCQIGSQSVRSQGAPVAVTRIDQEASTGKIQFKINIKNVGDGDVLKPGTLDKCSPLGGGILGRKDFDRVQLEKVQIGNVDLLGSGRCSPFADNTAESTHLIRLFDGEGFVICTLTVSELGSIQSAYTTPINIELKYSYRSTISKQIEIEKFVGIGSTPGPSSGDGPTGPNGPSDGNGGGPSDDLSEFCEGLGVKDVDWKCISVINGNTPAKTCVGEGEEREWSLSTLECEGGGQCYESEIVPCAVGEVCSASTNGCESQPPVLTSTIVPSSFISHKDDSVDLILDTENDVFCKIRSIGAYHFLVEDKFEDNGNIACKILDEDDYPTFTLTKKHRCGITKSKIEIAESGETTVFFDNRIKVGCMQGSFVDGAFEKTDGTFEGLLLEIEDVTRTEGIITSMSIKDTGADATFTIEGDAELPPLKITVLKGPRVVGLEEEVDNDLEWKTDRNTICKVKNTPVLSSDISETSYVIQHFDSINGLNKEDGSALYIGCKDIDDVFNSELFVIDRISPAKINNLEVTPEREGSKYKMTLTWTAPGDTRNSIKQYHVRAMNDTSLSSSNWYGSDAIKLEGDVYNDPPDPLPAGDTVTYVTKNAFEPNTLYIFAVRSEDSVGNIADLSNVIEVQTGG